MIGYEVLKDKNNWKLGLIIGTNALLLYTALELNSVQMMDLSVLLSRAQQLVPIGIASSAATLLNALLSADVKATLVYWRLQHALPGHRAFSVYSQNDTRINATRLLKSFNGTFPSAPAEQNAAWYKLCRTVRDDPAVRHANKVFLLLRDWTALSAFFLLVFGPWALVAMTDKLAAATYVGLLTAQFFLVRQGAHNTGVRMVTNVLAVKSAAVR